MDTAGLLDVIVIVDPGDVAGLVFGEGFEGLEGVVGGGVFFEEVAASPTVSEGVDDAKVGEGLARSFFDLANGAETALRVDEGAVFFAPTCSWQHEVSHLGGLGAVIHVLDDEEV